MIVRGKEELRSFVNGALAAIPDFKYGLRSRFATIQWAVIEWVMSGTHKGDLPGIQTTGKRFSSVRGSTVLELEPGKIHRESDYWDAATFMKQAACCHRNKKSYAHNERRNAMNKPNNKVAKGIGADIAKCLAAEGASVVINYASDRAGADNTVAVDDSTS